MTPLPSLAQQALDAAHDALDVGDLARAQRESERATAYAPNHPAPLMLAGDLARAAQQWDEAAHCYAQALEVAQDDEAVWYAHANFAEILLIQQQATEALTHAKAAIEIYPDQVDPYVAAARAYLLLRQGNNALRLLNEAVALEHDLAAPFVLRGELYAANRSYGDALNDFAQAIELDPANPRNYIAVAQIAMQTRDPQLALTTLDEGIQAVEPEQAEQLRELRARLLIQLGEREEGLRELDRVLSRLEEPPLATLLARAEARFDSGNVRDALSDYDAILARQPDHAEALEGKLDALIALERREEAGNLLEALAQQRPSADLDTRRAGYLWEEGQLDDARAAYEQALEREPRHPIASYNLALLLQEEGNVEQALPYLDLAVDIAPHDEERLCDRSVALLALGYAYLAWLDADRALEMDEEYIEGYVARARAAAALEEYEEAFNDLHSVLSLYPEYGDALATLARLHEQLGHHNEARDAWQQYLQLPAEEQAEEVVREARRRS